MTEYKHYSTPLPDGETDFTAKELGQWAYAPGIQGSYNDHTWPRKSWPYGK